MDSESKMNILRETLLTTRRVSAFVACTIFTLVIGLIALHWHWKLEEQYRQRYRQQLSFCV